MNGLHMAYVANKKHYGARLASCALLVALLLVIGALTFVCRSRRLAAAASSSDKAYTSVMSDIENITLANPLVSELAMLGSHDANTYNTDDNVGFSGDVNAEAMGLLHALAPGIVYRYTKTQQSDIYEQLCQGVRYLHIKCSFFDGEWYGCHSMIDGKLEIYIRDALRFLQEFSGEIVILTFLITFADGSSAAEFCDYVYGEVKYNGLSLSDFMPYDNVSYRDLTYNDVTLSGTRSGALVMLEGGDPEFDRNAFWDNMYDTKYRSKLSTVFHFLHSPWYNRMDTNAIADAINAKCEQIDAEPERFEGLYLVMQINVAPNGRDAMDTALAWSLLSKAEKSNLALLDHPDFDKWLRHMPILLCDNSTSSYGDFNRRANEKMIAYNTALVNARVLGAHAERIRP